MNREERIKMRYYGLGGANDLFHLFANRVNEKFNIAAVAMINGWVDVTDINVHIRSFAYSGILTPPTKNDDICLLKRYPLGNGKRFSMDIYTVTELCFGGGCICKKKNSISLYFDKNECDFFEYKIPSLQNIISGVFKSKLNNYSLKIVYDNSTKDNRFKTAREIIVSAKNKKDAVKRAKISKGGIAYSSCLNSNVKVQDLNEPEGYDDDFYLVTLL